MDELTLLHGVWVRTEELERFETYGVVDGILDIDVRKTGVSTTHCTSFGQAIDIGAHFGATAMYMARKFAKVAAFEAMPVTFEVLRKNTSSIENIEIHNVAASDTAVDLFFEYVPGHTQLSHVLDLHETRHFGGESQTVGPVPARPIDSYGFRDVGFIKIDVEGTELEVVKGAVNTILAWKPLILVEQGKNENKYHGRPVNEASDFLTELGMERVPDFPFWKYQLLRFPEQ
jgi:FkbM family methyltransferase